MNNDIDALFDESINLEINVGHLYGLFNNLFPAHAEFWWKLEFEEYNHASLIRSGRDHFKPVNNFPVKLLDQSLVDLKAANHNLQTLIEKYKKSRPSEEEAFNKALMIEMSAGELHFQEFMSKEACSFTEEIFKKLNKEDRDHAARIRDYMKQHGIEEI